MSNYRIIDGASQLVMREGTVQSFNTLQQRLNRKVVTARMLADFPAHIRAYDLLVDGQEDIRDLPLTARRVRLAAFLEWGPLRGGGSGIAGGNTIAGGTADGDVRGAVGARLVFWGGFVLCHGYDCTSTSEPWHRRQCVRELEEGMEKPPRTHQRPLTLAAFLPWGDWVT